MRARQLEVFTAVMKVGTITGAAKVLNISQPALSQILLHTEDDLGFKLFDRKKGRLFPTPEAHELYPEAERLFVGLEGLRRKSADLRLGGVGVVRVAASAPSAMSLLPEAMARFRNAHPKVHQRSHIAPISTLISMLRAGDVGMAMSLNDQLPSDIAVEKLGETGFCCLLPNDHVLSVKAEISLSDLEKETVISYRRMTRPSDELDLAARKVGALFAPQLEIDVSISAVGFVKAGLGVAVVDSLLPWAQFDGLVLRPLSEQPRLPVSLMTIRGKTLSRNEQIMRDQIRSVCAEKL